MFKNVAHKLDLPTAVEIGELVPIRCIRVKTNIDLSMVRINGIKYYSQDLESKLFVPERNRIIAETYLNYVKDKKTVVFCASVRHAGEISALFKQNGIKSEAVSGSMKSSERTGILEQYEHGEINVLCACDLLNEGWDSPKTEVLFSYSESISMGAHKCNFDFCLRHKARHKPSFLCGQAHALQNTLSSAAGKRNAQMPGQRIPDGL